MKSENSRRIAFVFFGILLATVLVPRTSSLSATSPRMQHQMVFNSNFENRSTRLFFSPAGWHVDYNGAGNSGQYKMLWEHNFNGKNVYWVSITPDGSYIAVGSLDHIYLFNRKGELLHEYYISNGIYRVSIAPDNSYVAVVGDLLNRNYLYIFTMKGELLRKHYFSNENIRCVSIAPDGSYVVAGGFRLYLFNKEGELVWERDISGGIYQVSIAPDNSYIAVGSFNHIYLFNRKGDLLWKQDVSGELVWKRDVGRGMGVESVSIAPDGSYIAVGSFDVRSNHIYLFNRKGDLLWKQDVSVGIYWVSITPDGSYVAAGSNHIYLFNRKGELLHEYYISGGIYQVSIAPDGSYIAVVGRSYIYLFNRKGDLLWKHDFSEDIESVSIAPDGSYIAVGSFNHIYLFNRKGELVWEHYIGGHIYRMSITPDGSYIAVVVDDEAYLFAKMSTELSTSIQVNSLYKCNEGFCSLKAFLNRLGMYTTGGTPYLINAEISVNVRSWGKHSPSSIDEVEAYFTGLESNVLKLQRTSDNSWHAKLVAEPVYDVHDYVNTIIGALKAAMEGKTEVAHPPIKNPDVILNYIIFKFKDGNSVKIKYNKRIPTFIDALNENLPSWARVAGESSKAKLVDKIVVLATKSYIGVVDENGRRTGTFYVNGHFVDLNEISGSVYVKPLRMIYLPGNVTLSKIYIYGLENEKGRLVVVPLESNAPVKSLNINVVKGEAMVYAPSGANINLVKTYEYGRSEGELFTSNIMYYILISIAVLVIAVGLWMKRAGRR